MKTLLTFLVCFATTALALAANYSASEKFSQTYPFSEKGELSLENINGTVEIIAWDKSGISVEAEKRAGDTDDLQKIIIHVDATPSRLAIKTEYQRTGWFGFSVKGEVRYTVKVPAGIALHKIETVNGQVTVSDVRGPVTASTVNGNINAEGLVAHTSLETVNGNISARFDEVASGQTISLKTVNGSCKLSLPSDAAAYVKAQTVNGGVNSKVPIKQDEARRNKLHGQIGQSPGANIEAESVNGNITLDAG